MHVTMVKKVLLDGSACKKCDQAEELLKRRGLWEKIDEVVWAKESRSRARRACASPNSTASSSRRSSSCATMAGEKVYTSVLELDARQAVAGRERRGVDRTVAARGGELDEEDVDDAQPSLRPRRAHRDDRLAARPLRRSATIAFSGAEDVALIDMAAQTKKPFSVFTLDTGRLHPETYRFLDKVRNALRRRDSRRLAGPRRARGARPKKGTLQLLRGRPRRVLRHPQGGAARARAPRTCRAWITGQRRDQSPTRTRGRALRARSRARRRPRGRSSR